MLRLAILTMVLGSIQAAPAAGSEEPERRVPGDQPGEPTEPSHPSDEDASWEIQFAGHGGIAGLVSRGEVRLLIASISSPVDETVGYSREGSWGAGLRVIRGRWGLEVQHHRVAGRGFMPAAMVRETNWRGAQELAITDSANDLLSVFAVREFSLRDERVRFYLAAGGGYLLMGGDSGRLALNDIPPGISGEYDFGGESYEASVEVVGGDFRADRGALVFGGSLGLTLRTGRMFLRPRLDAFVGRARDTEESWDMRFDNHEVGNHGRDTMTLQTSVRPRFLLFSVDFGWSSRP